MVKLKTQEKALVKERGRVLVQKRTGRISLVEKPREIRQKMRSNLPIVNLRARREKRADLISIYQTQSRRWMQKQENSFAQFFQEMKLSYSRNTQTFKLG